jgi:hypothetical protein
VLVADEDLAQFCSAAVSLTYTDVIQDQYSSCSSEDNWLEFQAKEIFE